GGGRHRQLVDVRPAPAVPRGSAGGGGRPVAAGRVRPRSGSADGGQRARRLRRRCPSRQTVDGTGLLPCVAAASSVAGDDGDETKAGGTGARPAGGGRV